MQTRYCGRCGAPITGDELYCTRCGAELQAVQPESATPTVTGQAGDAYVADHSSIANRLWNRGPTRLSLFIIVGFLFALLVALLWWGIVRTSELDRALDLRTSERDDARATIGQLSEDLATSQGSLNEAQGTIDTLRITLEGRDQCISALADAQARLSELYDRGVVINNATAEDSRWTELDTARTDALLGVIDAYYNAYSLAFDGDYDGANYWIGQGNALVDTGAAHTAEINTIIDELNRDIDQLDTDLAALDVDIAATASTCGSDGGLSS